MDFFWRALLVVGAQEAALAVMWMMSRHVLKYQMRSVWHTGEWILYDARSRILIAGDTGSRRLLAMLEFLAAGCMCPQAARGKVSYLDMSLAKQRLVLQRVATGVRALVGVGLVAGPGWISVGASVALAALALAALWHMWMAYGERVTPEAPPPDVRAVGVQHIRTDNGQAVASVVDVDVGAEPSTDVYVLAPLLECDLPALVGIMRTKPNLATRRLLVRIDGRRPPAPAARAASPAPIARAASPLVSRPASRSTGPVFQMPTRRTPDSIAALDAPPPIRSRMPKPAKPLARAHSPR